MGRIKEDKNGRFVNPYNFIPLKEKCEREIPQINEKDCYTGYFDCRMELLTHLFIPNTSSDVRLLSGDEEEGHKGYDFFSYDDWSEERGYVGKQPLPPENPVIPGSEIRGVVRSVYEAAFNGCMSSVDVDRELSRRCGEPKEAGILFQKKETKEWFLKKCKTVNLGVKQESKQVSKHDRWKIVSRKMYDNWEEGQKVWFKAFSPKGYRGRIIINIRDKKPEKENEFEKGYLHKGEYIKGKEFESVFCESVGRTEVISVRNEDVELLKRVVDEYRDKKKNSQISEQNKQWYDGYKVSEEGTLVYFAEIDKKYVYMCPACIGRESFIKTIGSLLERNGGYQPCCGEALCSSCQIFGMMEKMEKPGTYAYGSKVRITDAVLLNSVDESDTLFEHPIVLDELGEPRLSAVEFYTESPYMSDENKGRGSGYWTYDYKYNYEERNSKPIREYLSKNKPKIRGRKYYWHGDVKRKEYEGNAVSTMRQRIRPLKPSRETGKSVFQFRVYFEQLDKKQLNQLKWALDFGNSDCAHKIGRAKPLGFGSVKIIVDSMKIRKIDEETGGWRIETIRKDGKLTFEKFFESVKFSVNEIPEALKMMSNWSHRPKNLHYPEGLELNQKKGEDNANAAASHQWFKLNKGDNNFYYNFSKVLPDAEEEFDKSPGEGKALYKLVGKRK